MSTLPKPSAPLSEEELLPAGYLSKAHGIRGELVFTLTGELPDSEDCMLYLRPRAGGAFRPYRLRASRVHHGSLLLSLEGVATRNEAELLRSHTVFVARQSLPPPEGAALLRDVQGFSVLWLDEQGRESELGRIEEASAPAGQLLWAIRDAQGREILFPAVEEFIRGIDRKAQIARIAPPPGLLDIYLGG